VSDDLFSALWRSDPGRIEELLRAGADINARDEYGRTPLMTRWSRSVRAPTSSVS